MCGGGGGGGAGGNSMPPLHRPCSTDGTSTTIGLKETMSQWRSHTVLIACFCFLSSCGIYRYFITLGARCTSVVRAFAHGAVGRRIDPSWGGPIELFLVTASAPRLV